MSRFVLVHGAWHDGRCWDRLVVELARRGHDATAVDLPSDRPGSGALDYAATVEAAASAAPEPCVLVGHSLGGLTVPVVAERLGPDRVAALVLVAALLPQPGRSFDDQTRDGVGGLVEGFGRGQRRHEDRTTSWPPARAAAELYRDVAGELERLGSSAEPVGAAVARLRRQAWTVTRETTPLTSWPVVPTTVVVCTEDRVVDPDRLRERARARPGVEVVELPGGHFPMLTRPAALADVLVSG